MFIPYDPCDDCLFGVCDKCGYNFLKINYHRALKRIAELSPTPITILVSSEEELECREDEIK